MRAPGRSTAISTLIAHPDEAEGAALRAVLKGGERVRVVALTGDGAEAVALARRLRPAVTLLDDRVPAPPGTDLLPALARWSLVIVLTSARECAAICAILRGPVRGCLVYGEFEPADLVAAVRAVAAGLAWLSPSAVAAASRSLRGCQDASARDSPRCPRAARKA